MSNLNFIETEMPISIKKPQDYSLTKEDVWGIFDVASAKRISKGMIVARYDEICPIFKDKVPFKSVTIVGPIDKLDEIEYWIEYVNGYNSISQRKQISSTEIALRSDYTCW